jgi:exonuclease SbcC
VEELRKKLDGLRARWEALVQEGGRLQERLEALEEALKRRREVEGRLARLVQELDLWAKLSQDLQEDNFPAYLLGQRQEALRARANELLHALSGDRYRVVADGDDYLVLDRWAEVERPVRTLSGGESFLVSLALALALSEELSKGRLGAFFLDEGFGTLDGETLEMVAGVLEALPTGGRLVGIVTHVEALAERLPARLRVRKTPRGSWVEWA